MEQLQRHQQSEQQQQHRHIEQLSQHQQHQIHTHNKQREDSIVDIFHSSLHSGSGTTSLHGGPFLDSVRRPEALQDTEAGKEETTGASPQDKSDNISVIWGAVYRNRQHFIDMHVR